MNYLTTSKLIGYLAIIFLAGGATGAVITLKNSRAQEVQTPSVEKTCNRLQNRLVSKLGLTPEQVKTLQPVFDQSARELRAIHSKAMCATDEVIRRAHEQIARELTPEQKLKLELLDKERADWLHHKLKGPDPDSERAAPPPDKRL